VLPRKEREMLHALHALAAVCKSWKLNLLILHFVYQIIRNFLKELTAFRSCLLRWDIKFIARWALSQDSCILMSALILWVCQQTDLAVFWKETPC
jgi:hypothetical protein